MRILQDAERSRDSEELGNCDADSCGIVGELGEELGEACSDVLGGSGLLDEAHVGGSRVIALRGIVLEIRLLL